VLADALDGRRGPAQPAAGRRDAVPLQLARYRTQRPATSTVDPDARGDLVTWSRAYDLVDGHGCPVPVAVDALDSPALALQGG